MRRIIQQKVRQYLVHSFLYYQLDESLISDNYYDQICNEILDFKERVPDKYFVPYQDLVTESLAGNASGFSIRKYPSEIISSALHLLYQHNYSKSLPFRAFLARFGYGL